MQSTDFSRQRVRRVAFALCGRLVTLSCVGVLAATGCALRTSPSFDAGDLTLDAGSEKATVAPPKLVSAADGGGTPAATSFQDAAGGSSSNTHSMNASSPAAAGPKAQSDASVGSSNDASSIAPKSPTTAATAKDDDAGAPAVADAGSVSGAKQQQCDAALSRCLLRDPLGYDVCLRENAEQGCPEPDSMGAATTTPVLDENGKPISQVCQAELAKCIMRLPTPENAAECTETARKCK